MNSTFEKNNTKPTMAELQAMQKTALNRNIDKAGNIQKAVTLTEENWTGLNIMRQEQTETLKKFEKQVGRASEKYSSELSEVTTSMKHSANRLQWQLYLPTIILVLWELVRHLFLLD